MRSSMFHLNEMCFDNEKKLFEILPNFQAVLDDAHMPSNLNAKSWMVAGSGGNLIAALLVYPADMLKTRLIVQNVNPSLSNYHGIIHGFRKILKTEGFVALYKGLLPTFLGEYLDV